jgi:hypothetical protein
MELPVLHKQHFQNIESKKKPANKTYLGQMKMKIKFVILYMAC